MKKPFVFLAVACALQLTACSIPSGVFEKDLPIPGQQWESSFRPRIEFTIKEEDTAALYDLYMVIRHMDSYAFNNIWIMGTLQEPGNHPAEGQRYNCNLVKPDNKEWAGTGMDDIYEVRVPLKMGIEFRRPGTYSFLIEQIMREDPLKHVLQVGLRVEKEQ